MNSGLVSLATGQRTRVSVTTVAEKLNHSKIFEFDIPIFHVDIT